MQHMPLPLLLLGLLGALRGSLQLAGMQLGAAGMILVAAGSVQLCKSRSITACRNKVTLSLHGMLLCR